MNKVLYIILISLFSLTVFSCSEDKEESTTDTTAPVIAEVTVVTTPTTDSTPNYTFSSTEAGTITYGGSCSSGTTTATSGNNTITFIALSEGTYSNCTIVVKDSAGNASNTLAVTTFIVNTTSYVSVGDSGTILTSSDGTTWTSMTSGTSKLLNDVTHGNSIFVTVGYGGTILTSPDNGTTWNDRSKTKRLWGVTYGNSTFMVVGNSGTIYTSSDGTTWTSRTSNTSKDLENVTYGNSTFVTVGSSGTILTSSDNGSTWTSRTSGTSNTLEGVTYSNNTFVTVGSSGTILTSSDNGTSWDNRTSGTTQNLHDVTYGNSTFVTVGNSGTILTSSDATTWTTRTSGTSNYLEDVTYRNSIFVTVGQSGTILTSSDGTTWTSRTSGTTNNLYGVTNTDVTPALQGGNIQGNALDLTNTTTTLFSYGSGHALSTDGTYLYVCGSPARRYKISDNSYQNLNFNCTYDLEPASDYVYYMSSYTAVYKAADNGTGSTTLLTATNDSNGLTVDSASTLYIFDAAAGSSRSIVKYNLSTNTKSTLTNLSTDIKLLRGTVVGEKLYTGGNKVYAFDKSNGSKTDLISASTIEGVCSDGIYIYYPDSTLKKYHINNGTISNVASINGSFRACTTDGTHLYYTSTNGNVYKIAGN